MQRLGQALFTSLSFTSLATAALTAHAQTAPNAPEACRAIHTEKDRLACYDRIFGAPEGSLMQEPNPAAAENPPPEARPASLLDERWELSKRMKQGTFHVSPHKPVYILAAFHSSRANETPSSPNEENTVTTPLDIQNTEVKYQISFKSKLWEEVLGTPGDLWFGYTQSSRWQLYNAEQSRPFRETDYEPELILNFRTTFDLPWGWKGRMAGVSFTHASNGRNLPLSRSWNRVIGWVGIDRPGWTLMARHWWRVDESGSSDDNPDIEDYMGRGELLMTRDWRGHEISALLRHSFKDGDRSRGAVELNWAFPIHGELKGYLQFFSGYGESLIDYNHSANYVGLGVSLVEWYSSTARTRRN